MFYNLIPYLQTYSIAPSLALSPRCKARKKMKYFQAQVYCGSKLAFPTIPCILSDGPLERVQKGPHTTKALKLWCQKVFSYHDKSRKGWTCQADITPYLTQSRKHRFDLGGRAVSCSCYNNHSSCSDKAAACSQYSNIKSTSRGTKFSDNHHKTQWDRQ